MRIRVRTHKEKNKTDQEQQFLEIDKKERKTKERDTSFYNKVMQLHKNVGNKTVGHLYETGELQAKLQVSNPTDKHELEADRVAEQILQTSHEKPQNFFV